MLEFLRLWLKAYANIEVNNNSAKKDGIVFV